MATYKTPKQWTKLGPDGISKFYNRFQKDFLGYYFNEGELATFVKSIKGFNPMDYDIPYTRMDGFNSSFLLTPHGYAINVTIFQRNRKEGILPKLRKDGVIYTPNKDTGLISIDDMTKPLGKRNPVSYKELCNRFLKSSYTVLSDVAHKKTHPFTNFM